MRATRFFAGLLTLATLTSAAPAIAQDKFPLSRCVPADVFVCVAGRHNPERAFLDEAWSGVFKAFHDSGVIGDVCNLVTGFMDAEQRATASTVLSTITELLGGVHWCDLFEKDWTVSMRMNEWTTDMVLAVRVDTAKAEKNYEGLVAILKEIHKHAAPHVELDEVGRHGADVAALRVVAAPFPLSIAVAHRDDVICLAFCQGLLDDQLAALAGTSKKPLLVESARFRKALEKLPPAEDELSFFDAQNLFAGLERLFDGMSKMLENQPRSAQIFNMYRTLIADLRVVDFAASTSRTDGMRVFTDAVSFLAPDAKSCRAYPLFVPNKRIDAFDRFVPKEAVTFSASACGDLNAAYAWLRSFMQDEVPGGPGILKKLDDLQAEYKFDLQRDLLSWIQGSHIAFATQSSNPMTGDEAVHMIRVSDEQVAAAKARAALEHLSIAVGRHMPSQPGAGEGDSPFLVTKPVTIAGRKGFYRIEINHPMLMMVAMQFQPVWGVADGYLFLGTSASAIERCLQTADGKHDNVRKNKRFMAEGLLPPTADANVVNISFTDESRTAEELQAVCGAVGMVGAFAGMGAGNHPGVAKFIQGLSSIAAKLGPVMGKLNFFQSSAACTTFDGQSWFTRSVSNYRKPPAKSAPADDWGDDWGDPPAKKKDAKPVDPD